MYSLKYHIYIYIYIKGWDERIYIFNTIRIDPSISHRLIHVKNNSRATDNTI